MSNVVRKQFITNGNITFPAGVTVVKFKGCGGGGGGGAGGGSTAGSSGGGGGAGGGAVVTEIEVLVVSNRQYNVTIGAGGVGGAGAVGANGAVGGAGGNTTIVDSVSGFILVGFRGASGGSGGTVGAATGAVAGCDHTDRFGGNIFDLQNALNLTPPPVSNPIPLARSGGSGGA